MSDHSHRHTKPTSEEVYQDAKRILEEYLKRKLKDTEPNHSKYGRSESYKAASKAGEDEDENQDDLHGSRNGIGRSKTMPSSFKVEKDSQNKNKKANKNISHEYSSPDTDLDEPHDDSSHQRKKKSFFKRATERLMHAIHRDRRSGDDDVNIHESKDKRKKIKRKNKKEVHDSPDMNTSHEKNTHIHIDSHISSTSDRRAKGDTLDIPDDKSSHHDSHSSSSRRNSAGKKILDSIRKSFRKSKRSNITESKSAEPVDSSERERSYSRSISTPDRNLAAEGGHRSRSSSKTPEQKDKKAHGLKHGDSAGQRQRTDILVSQSTDHSAPRTIHVYGGHVDKGLFPNLAPPNPPSSVEGAVIESSVDIDRKYVTIADDGLLECHVTTHSHERVKILPQTSIEIDGSVGPQDETDDVDSPTDSTADKDEAIDKIVKKLIEIGDNLSSESESHRSQEAEGAVGGTPGRGDIRLSTLERQILECLREGGDRMSHNIEEHANEFIDGAVRETVYQKFCTTLRQSVGDEVNWNQMALVFHATKSALKVAGVGSKMANQLKDLTLTYVTDKCASWIVDQGGWESIVSDSDSELD
ncbi:protein starmaker-like isoform X2 [Haliotis asinina]